MQTFERTMVTALVCWRHLLFTSVIRILIMSYIPTSMERKPSRETNNSYVSQEIHRILWKPAVHFRSQKTSFLVRILNQTNPVQALLFYFFRHIILPTTHTHTNGFYTSGFFQPSPACTSLLPHTLYDPPISFFLT
jgi:hypothetical protein